MLCMISSAMMGAIFIPASAGILLAICAIVILYLFGTRKS